MPVCVCEQKKRMLRTLEKRGKSRSCPFKTIHKDMNTLSQAHNKEGGASFGCCHHLRVRTRRWTVTRKGPPRTTHTQPTTTHTHTQSASLSFSRSSHKTRNNKIECSPTHAKKRGEEKEKDVQLTSQMWWYFRQ